MKRVHLIFGILLFVVFLITGQFMRTDFPDKDSIDQMHRVLMRSRHIYILFSAFIHIVLGIYLDMRPGTVPRSLQYMGSVLLLLASALLVWAFVSETYIYAEFSEISRYGIYASLVGVFFHLASGLSFREGETRPPSQD